MNSVPLVDALNLKIPSLHGSKNEVKGIGIKGVLGVFDSDRTDARFLLSILACEYEKIVWISCAPSGSERNIKFACKKTGRSGVRSDITDSKISVIHVPAEFADIVENNNCDQRNNIKNYVGKKILGKIKQEIHGIENSIVVADDLSLLSVLLGQNLTYGLVQCVLSNLSRNMIFRASLDIDQNNLFRESKGDWLDRIQDSDALGLRREGVWERSLIQLCDTRVDVVPLESGFSREARGRIIISNDHGSEALNYVCGDIGVRAIRMHKER